MERYLQKPQMKNEEEFMKQEYPEKTQQLYHLVCDKLGEIQAEDLDFLIEQVYKLRILTDSKMRCISMIYKLTSKNEKSQR